jgi:hypothetical protein
MRLHLTLVDEGAYARLCPSDDGYILTSAPKLETSSPCEPEELHSAVPMVIVKMPSDRRTVIEQADRHLGAAGLALLFVAGVRDPIRRAHLDRGGVLMRQQPIVALKIVLLTASALAVAGCGTSTTTKQNTYTITEPVTSLKVDNPVGNTQIEGTDATTVSVTEQLSYTGSSPQTSHPITGGQLTLSYTCPSGVVNVNCSVTYVVKMPRRIAVQIDDKVGSTTLTGLAGELTLTSDTGNIDATGLTSGAVSARANAGTITLRFTTPPTTVDARAQVGSVKLRLPAGTAYAVDAGSQVGNAEVTVQRDPGSAHRVTAQSQVGSVNVNNG